MSLPHREEKALHKILAALHAKGIAQSSARALLYGTAAAMIYAVATGDSQLLAAAPGIGILIEKVGGGALRSLIELVARDEKQSVKPEQIRTYLESTITNALGKSILTVEDLYGALGAFNETDRARHYEVIHLLNDVISSQNRIEEHLPGRVAQKFDEKFGWRIEELHDGLARIEKILVDGGQYQSASRVELDTLLDLVTANGIELSTESASRIAYLLESLGDETMAVVRSLLRTDNDEARTRGLILMILAPKQLKASLLRLGLLGQDRNKISKNLQRMGELASDLLVSHLIEETDDEMVDILVEEILRQGAPAAHAIRQRISDAPDCLKDNMLSLLNAMPYSEALDALSEISTTFVYPPKIRLKARKFLIRRGEYRRKPALKLRIADSPKVHEREQSSSPHRRFRREEMDRELKIIHRMHKARELFTTRDLANEMSVTPSTIRRWAKQLRIKASYPRVSNSIYYYSAIQADLFRKYGSYNLKKRRILREKTPK